METAITEEQQVKRRTAKPLLWMGMIGMLMFFGGLTSYYLVRNDQSDWISFDLPEPFFVSTGLIVLSSITMIIASLSIKKSKFSQAKSFMLATLILGIGFVIGQFVGYDVMTERGMYFTGASSSVSYSIMYVITFFHVLHVVAGLVVLLVTHIQLVRGRYTSDSMLGFELASIFWHFLGVLWLYLLLFLVFIR